MIFNELLNYYKSNKKTKHGTNNKETIYYVTTVLAAISCVASLFFESYLGSIISFVVLIVTHLIIKTIFRFIERKKKIKSHGQEEIVEDKEKQLYNTAKKLWDYLLIFFPDSLKKEQIDDLIDMASTYLYRIDEKENKLYKNISFVISIAVSSGIITSVACPEFSKPISVILLLSIIFSITLIFISLLLFLSRKIEQHEYFEDERALEKIVKDLYCVKLYYDKLAPPFSNRDEKSK